MQIFGLVMLMITVFGGVYFVSLSRETLSPTAEKDDLSTYSEAIDASKQATETLTEAGGTKIEVYEGIRVSDKSTVLDLSNKKLNGSLKAEVRHLKALSELKLRNNNFTGIPAEIGQLSELLILNLSNNPITGLPQEIANLQKLQVLDLRNTTYSKQDLELIKVRLPKTTKVLTN